MATAVASETPREIVDDWEYYTKNLPDKEAPIYCRKWRGHARDHGAQQKEAEEEEVVLDLDDIFPTARYLCLGRLVVSPDHKYVAFTLDDCGDEVFDLFVKNMSTGKIELRINNANCIEWANGCDPDPYVLYFSYVAPTSVVLSLGFNPAST